MQNFRTIANILLVTKKEGTMGLKERIITMSVTTLSLLQGRACTSLGPQTEDFDIQLKSCLL